MTKGQKSVLNALHLEFYISQNKCVKPKKQCNFNFIDVLYSYNFFLYIYNFV